MLLTNDGLLAMMSETGVVDVKVTPTPYPDPYPDPYPNPTLTLPQPYPNPNPHPKPFSLTLTLTLPLPLTPGQDEDVLWKGRLGPGLQITMDLETGEIRKNVEVTSANPQPLTSPLTPTSPLRPQP